MQTNQFPLISIDWSILDRVEARLPVIKAQLDRVDAHVKQHKACVDRLAIELAKPAPSPRWAIAWAIVAIVSALAAVIVGLTS